MTDPADPGRDPERSGDADRERQDEVRRLLAAAGAERPRTPPEVAARLDDVLSRLAAERTTAVPRADHLGGPVLPTEVVGADDLASRRRRRWPQVLVAAAAVSVLGLGVSTVLDGGATQEDEAASSDAAGAAAPESALRAAELPSVRAVSLATDVQRIEDLAVAQPARRRRALERACVTPHIGAGDEWVRIRYDREPAVLVLRAPSADRRTAEVFTCESARDPVASTTVRAR